MTEHTRSISLYKTAVSGLSLLAVLSVIAYIGFTAATIFATAERTAAQRESKNLTAAIGDLERSYFEIEHTITPEEASRRGFIQPGRVSFVTPQTAATFSVSTNTGR